MRRARHREVPRPFSFTMPAMRFAFRALVLVLALAAAPARAADPLAITATPVPLDTRDDKRITAGQLTYRGGLMLEANDSRFGGWSDLKLTADGAKLTAISDRGFWFDARVVYDAGGRLQSLADARLGHLIG